MYFDTEMLREHIGLGSRPWGCGFGTHWRHCVVSLSKTHLSILVQPRKTRPDITGKFLTGK